MRKSISRRGFFRRSFGLGAGAVLARGLSGFQAASQGGSTPLIITSHANETGKKAVEEGWKILEAGGSALDAVEKGANIIELDPEGHGVGWGGLPNEEGVVQLDASVMDGRTYNAGSVACLENIRTPCSVARVVMEKTDHVMLAGHDALRFAKLWGFPEQELLTEQSRKIWLTWKQKMSERDDWGPPDHLKDIIEQETGEDGFTTGTTNVLAVDRNGDIAGITTTSGLSFKIPGRVGDSPIIGAGLYVDNEVGAAGATGRGEDVIKACASFYMVMRMKEGRTPQQAVEDALRLIVEKYRKVNPGFLPGEQFVAINKRGELGAARMSGERNGRMSVRTSAGFRFYEGSVLIKG